MKSLVKKYYSGYRALRYEKNREKGMKWAFEDNFVTSRINNLPGVRTVADAPVGTNRFYALWEDLAEITMVSGYDYSTKMIEISKTKFSTKMRFEKIDLLDPEMQLQVKYDLVLSLRFFNLISFDDVWVSFANLVKLTQRYLMISIRLQDVLDESQLIENKIFVHNYKRFMDMMESNGVIQVESERFIENRMGVYYMMLLKK
jgi:ubiquinone/menaquinone biosynthesis C-methylase UbiE